MGAHLIDGEFQSDKYPTCPPGKVPLSVRDASAQDLLWVYAQRRRTVDTEFSADLETALVAAGYTPPSDTGDDHRCVQIRLTFDPGMAAFKWADAHVPDDADVMIAAGIRRVAMSTVGSWEAPLPMVLHCPACGTQHIDAPEPETGWANPPHKSHLCARCGVVWRPADVPTTGVEAVATRGVGDTWTGTAARPLAEYHEDYGAVLWWMLPVEEPPYVGTPHDSDWPGYHTHWTPLPPVPKDPQGDRL